MWLVLMREAELCTDGRDAETGGDSVPIDHVMFHRVPSRQSDGSCSCADALLKYLHSVLLTVNHGALKKKPNTRG